MSPLPSFPVCSAEQGRPLGVELTADQLNALYYTGYTLHETGDYVRAADAFRLLVLCEPLHVEAWHALGSCHEHRDDLKTAAKLYEAGFRLGGHDVRLGLLCARAHLGTGDPFAAREMLDEIGGLEVPDQLRDAYRGLLLQVSGRSS